METNVSLPLLRETSDAIDIAEILSLLKRRFWLIASCVMGGVCVALATVMMATPQFTSNGALYLGDAQTAAAGGSGDQTNLGFGENFAAQSDVETQIELITSKALVQQALIETGLNATVEPHDAKPLKYWQWALLDGKQITDYLPASDALKVLYAQNAGAYKIVLGDNASFALYTKNGIFSTPSRPILRGVLGQPASGNGVHLLVQPAGAGFTGRPGETYDVSVQEPGALADKLIGSALMVNAGGSFDNPTKIAFLEFHWHNPYEAGDFLNQVMRDFISTQLDWKTQSASTTENFVANQLATVRASLAAADNNLAAYQSQTGIVDVPQNAQASIATLTQYQTQLSALNLQVDALRQLSYELHRKRGTVNPYLISQADDPVLSSLTNTLSDGEVKLSGLLAQYQPGAQDVKVQQAQVRNTEEAIIVTVDNELTAALKKQEGLDTMIASYKADLKVMPAEALKVISLQRSSDVLGQLYVLLMEKEQEAEVSKAATILNTRIITSAAAPDSATSPKMSISVIFGAVAGLVLGLSIVFGKRASSGRFESEGEIRKSIALPIFGSIPYSPKQNSEGGRDIALPRLSSAPWSTKPWAGGSLVIRGSRDRQFFEAFRLLRGAIYRNMTKGKPMVILVISATEADGKTTVAATLAKVLAEDGRHVALVDGDLYRGGLQERFRRDPSKQNDAEDAGHAATAGDFTVLPLNAPIVGGHGGGSPRNMSEEVLTERFATMREAYEFIIVDSPPLPSVADGMTLGVFADLILSVVSVSHTSRRAFAAHNELLSVLRRPHGIVINMADWHDEYGIAA
jgi:tyrosine-protein kinase Etk/Wzc